MADTITNLGRMKLPHPDLDYTGGPGLETLIKALYTLISDAMPSRFFAQTIYAYDSATFEHNFGCDFSELSFKFFIDPSWGADPTNLQRIPNISLGTWFSVVADPTEPTKKVVVTNLTGDARPLVLCVSQWPRVERLRDLLDIDWTTPPTAGQALIWDAMTEKFKPATAGAAQTKDNLTGLIDGSRNGGGIFLKKPDGTIREIALDASDNIVVLTT